MTKLSMRARKGVLLTAASFGAVGFAGQAHAAAFYLQEQSTKAIGRAFSGEVSERGAQQQYWNPAAIGGITGIQNYVGFTAIVPRATASDLGTTVQGPALFGGSSNTVGGTSQKNMVDNGYLPNGGFAIPLGKFAFGFTMASPYSFTSNYKKASFARYGNDKTRLRTFDFQPSLAYAPNEHISIGASLNADYQHAVLSNYLPDPIAPVKNPDGRQYLKGNGWDFGYTVGFQYHDDKVDLGASYKSAIKHTLKGKLVISGFDPAVDPLAGILNQQVDGAKASFTLPWQVTLGGRYHLTPAFTVNAQITRFGWDKFETIQLADLPALLGDQAIPENYHNTFSYALGFDYKLNQKMTVRGGVQRDLSPVPKDQKDARVPDGNRWNFAAGGSYEVNQFMGLDLAASYIKIKSGPINKTETLLAPPVTETLFNDGYLHGAKAYVFSVGAHLNL